MGGLKTGEVRAVEAFGGGCFMHLGDVRRNILQQHALAVSQLHVRSALQGAQDGCYVRADVSLSLFFTVLELQMRNAILILHETVRLWIQREIPFSKGMEAFRRLALIKEMSFTHTSMWRWSVPLSWNLNL